MTYEDSSKSGEGKIDEIFSALVDTIDDHSFDKMEQFNLVNFSGKVNELSAFICKYVAQTISFGARVAPFDTRTQSLLRAAEDAIDDLYANLMAECDCEFCECDCDPVEPCNQCAALLEAEIESEGYIDHTSTEEDWDE